MTPVTGLVSLVGAGPGDPELLTRRAAARLEAADLVLYDALVPEEVVRLAGRAQRFRVGKRAGRASVTQETINRLMIRAASRGRRVVRLKCGDPFVLGRGGEEALALTQAGVPCEIVPGVSAALAAPALAGIPVTHRGLASGFLVCSGHDPRAFASILGTLEPNSVTLVVLMGVATKGRLAAHLIERGWRRDTPAALVFDASRPDGAVWIGTLAALPDQVPVHRTDAPGTIVIGDVVSLAAAIGAGAPMVTAGGETAERRPRRA